MASEPVFILCKQERGPDRRALLAKGQRLRAATADEMAAAAVASNEAAYLVDAPALLGEVVLGGGVLSKEQLAGEALREAAEAAGFEQLPMARAPDGVLCAVVLPAPLDLLPFEQEPQLSVGVKRPAPDEPLLASASHSPALYRPPYPLVRAPPSEAHHNKRQVGLGDGWMKPWLCVHESLVHARSG